VVIDAQVYYSRFDCLGRPFGPEAIIRELDRFKIDAAVLVSGMSVDVDFRVGNQELLQVIKADPRLYGCMVSNPIYPAESIELMRTAMTSPRVVAMALFNGASTPYPSIEDCREIINSYRRYAKPIYLHTPSAESVVAAVQIAKEFPGIKFVLGSMGGADWRMTIPFAKQLNLVLETSGSFDSEKIEMAVNAFGAHRVMFGSSYPFSDIASMLALIQSSGIPKESLAQVLDGTARSLFGIGRPAREAVEE
jgi:uncharacterized protein